MIEQGTVLLAEDDADDVLLTQIAFDKARLANPLQVVRDGEEAIAYLKGQGRFSNRHHFPFPILLLLDLKMPKLNGFQVLEWLRHESNLQHLPVASDDIFRPRSGRDEGVRIGRGFVSDQAAQRGDALGAGTAPARVLDDPERAPALR
jgi:CheY-like chemotaxis protein